MISKRRKQQQRERRRRMVLGIGIAVAGVVVLLGLAWAGGRWLARGEAETVDEEQSRESSQ